MEKADRSVPEWRSEWRLSGPFAKFMDRYIGGGCIAFLRQKYTIRYRESDQTVIARVRLHSSATSISFRFFFSKFSILLYSDTVLWQLTACGIAGMLVWLCICLTMRYTLKLLLMYKGWMYESREKGRSISTTTKVWAAVTKVLSSWNTPGLYSFQSSLPRLPLPSVHETMSRYLDSVRPLLDDENYARMERLAKEFESTIGSKLQRYLVLKSWWSTNYVSDWWEEYVYLRGRGALMVNSNFYGIDALFLNNTNVQSARAATVVNLLLVFRRLVERQELQPVCI